MRWTERYRQRQGGSQTKKDRLTSRRVGTQTDRQKDRLAEIPFQNDQLMHCSNCLVAFPAASLPEIKELVSEENQSDSTDSWLLVCIVTLTVGAAARKLSTDVERVCLPSDCCCCCCCCCCCRLRVIVSGCRLRFSASSEADLFLSWT